MQFIQNFSFVAFYDTTLSLLIAFVLGTLIGAERQYRQRTAGLRTNVLVAIGAATFVDLGQRMGGNVEAVRVIAYVVSGIGFLGAGVIMKEGMNVRGLNTAATLWCSAAVGCCAGGNMITEAVTLTFFVIFGNTFLRRLANAINRIPLNEETGESTFEIRLSVDRKAAPILRELVVDLLEKAQYPVSDVEFFDLSDDCVELVATLISTAIDKEEIEEVVKALSKRKDVYHANWESSTKE
ncbi:MgtC/SapB family protein [Commensalibacter papalotli (ex Servin-Garciduenas et al. 2014)]|uniref:Protein MgtC n=1 Tax=Commensalibacter papalotli (ex Servin-Garciduenas et al. 2014) TaxID=1208583 RepID=W7DJR3_9PROT|nr:MgtC/SapB family protein [Commensalibacter papalotli (ex Servin-Garciduenas et al. 2014)]EUK17567.1 MgtC/SapB transporter [Commensalibacter papalotli (ex Servin-Garciduenas et al. 2014)]